jgi:hypothetical protein
MVLMVGEIDDFNQGAVAKNGEAVGAKECDE